MSRNTGKRPHELALELFAKQPTVSPTELEKHVGNGPYSSKHVWFLRKLGHDITVNKEGKTVVSYTYNGIGTASAAVAKPAKAKKVSKLVSKAHVYEAKPVVKGSKSTIIDEVEATFGSSGAASSYSVDPDWDAVDNVKALL